MMKKWIGAIVLGMTLLVAGGCMNSEPPKAAVVDFEKIAVESKAGAEFQEKLEAQMKALDEEVKTMEAPKSQEEFMAKQQEIQQRARAIQQQLFTEFRGTIQKAASDIATEKKYSIVLAKDQVVVGSIDITDEVIAKLGGKVEKPAEETKAAEETTEKQ